MYAKPAVAAARITNTAGGLSARGSQERFMIALTGYYAYRRGIAVEPGESFVRQRWRLDTVDVPWFYDLCNR